MSQPPVPFDVHPSGAYLHGTRADLRVGELLRPGFGSNYEAGRVANHVYITTTLDAAAWAPSSRSATDRAASTWSSPPARSRTTRT